MPHGGVDPGHARERRRAAKRFEYALPVEAGPYVRVSVTDTGIGIPDENLGSIFDPYFSTKQKGSGLGLATSHSIVKNHGGFVTVESKLGCGTTIAASACRRCSRRRSRPLRMDHGPAAGGRRTHSRHGRRAGREDAGRQHAALPRARCGRRRIRPRRHRTLPARLKRGQPFDAVMLDLVVPGGMGGRETIDAAHRDRSGRQRDRRQRLRPGPDVDGVPRLRIQGRDRETIHAPGTEHRPQLGDCSAQLAGSLR